MNCSLPLGDEHAHWIHGWTFCHLNHPLETINVSSGNNKTRRNVDIAHKRLRAYEMVADAVLNLSKSGSGQCLEGTSGALCALSPPMEKGQAIKVKY